MAYYNGRVKDRSKRLYQRCDTGIGYFRNMGIYSLISVKVYTKEELEEELANFYAAGGKVNDEIPKKNFYDDNDLKYYGYFTRYERKKKAH